jgi:DNA repair exonuclease SbcCD ATPase subunit
VASNCPICDQPIPATVAHCSVCGFPTALAIEALRALGPNGATASEMETAAQPAPAPVLAPPPTPPSPEAELCAAISRDIQSKLEFVRQMGRGAPDVTSEMCQAAMSEAEGRVTEALDVLRRAQRSLERQTSDFLQRRVQSLTARDEVLRASGVSFALGPDLERLQAAVSDGGTAGAGELLAETESRIAQFESDWRGLQGLLRQIDTLHKEAGDLGLPLGEIGGELDEIRNQLKEPNLTEDRLDAIAQAAAQTLMLLHEAIPSSLETELARHETVIDRYPEDHPASAVARRLHSEASRHLKRGRLTDATHSVRELRLEIERLEQSREAQEIAVGEAPPAEPVPPESEAEALQRLLQKARTLAGRIRTLPADSEVARDAAVQIREVTDLLRRREVARADEALSRLMRMLAAEPEEG